MSRYIEILKLLPQVLGSPKKVIEGWINDAKLEAGKLSEEDMKIVLTRRSICSTCPLNSFNLKNNDSLYREMFGKPFETDRSDEFCSPCGCPIKAKSASLSSECGLSVYNQEYNTNIELKWNKK